MSDKRVTDLTSYTTPIDADVFPVVDTVGEATKKITLSNLIGAVGPTVTVGRSNAQYLCDGTDDNVQIQLAIDAVNAAGGGTVLIRAGTYNFTSNPTGATVALKTYLNNGADGLTIKGEGMGKTIINVTQHITYPANFFYSSGYDYVAVSDLSLIGDAEHGDASDGTEGHGIIFEDGDYFRVERCRIMNFSQNGIEVSVPRTGRGSGQDGELSNMIYIKDNVIITYQNACISTSQIRRAWIEGNYFGSADTPLSIGPGILCDIYEIYIRNNTFDWWGQDDMLTETQTTMGMILGPSYEGGYAIHDVYFTDNIMYPGFTSMFLLLPNDISDAVMYNIHIDRNTFYCGGMGITGNSYAIHLADTYDEYAILENISVCGNKIYYSQGGIKLENMRNVLVANNQIYYNVSGYGIGLEGAEDCQILNNTIMDGVGQGIRTLTTACERLKISGNSVIRMTDNGIQLSETNNSMITDNFVVDSDYLDTDNYMGIRLITNSNTNFIVNNKCFISNAAKYQLYGIYIAGANCDDNVVSFNDLRQGGQTGGLYNGGTSTLSDHNYT